MRQERTESVSGWLRALKFFRKCWHRYRSLQSQKGRNRLHSLACVVQIKKAKQTNKQQKRMDRENGVEGTPSLSDGG